MMDVEEPKLGKKSLSTLYSLGDDITERPLVTYSTSIATLNRLERKGFAEMAVCAGQELTESSVSVDRLLRAYVSLYPARLLLERMVYRHVRPGNIPTESAHRVHVASGIACSLVFVCLSVPSFF
jgi:hypothetical protein